VLLMVAATNVRMTSNGMTTNGNDRARNLDPEEYWLRNLDLENYDQTLDQN
jgi:hypothetical protein